MTAHHSGAPAPGRSSRRCDSTVVASFSQAMNPNAYLVRLTGEEVGDMAIALTPSQLKAICPDAPASAVLSLNSILARTGSVTHLRAAMLVAQLAVTSESFRRLEEEDGPRRPSAPFFGRSWIQLSGRRSYREAGTALDLDLVRHPELAVTSNTEVTAWFWTAHRLN